VCLLNSVEHTHTHTHARTHARTHQRRQVVGTLRDLASSGHTVVCSIHQPRSSIFKMFDDLLLLSEGRVVYFGPAEGVLQHFEAVSSVWCG
jgi:ABC-type multidrug transport system ATPase subunit